MYFHCYVYKTSKLLNVFWIIGTHNVYKIIDIFMDIFKNRITVTSYKPTLIYCHTFVFQEGPCHPGDDSCQKMA